MSYWVDCSDIEKLRQSYNFDENTKTRSTCLKGEKSRPNQETDTNKISTEEKSNMFGNIWVLKRLACKGNITLSIHIDLKNDLHLSKLSYNLLSISKICEDSKGHV